MKFILRRRMNNSSGNSLVVIYRKLNERGRGKVNDRMLPVVMKEGTPE